MNEAAPASGSLHGLRVVAFESRRAVEIAELIRRHGGEPISAPSMREVPLENNAELLAYLEGLEAGKIDVVIMLTGAGLRTLVKQVQAEWPAVRVAAAMRRAKIVARGPKPVAALREIGLQPDFTVPEPNTWRELLATLDAGLSVARRSVAVQEYGITNQELLDGLQQRGAHLLRIPIYTWALPENMAPLRSAIATLLDANAEAAVFTSANQVYTLFQVAEDERPGGAARLRDAMQRVVVASVGPICSDALREHGVEPDLQPEHPKLGPLLATLSRDAQSVLVRKRAD